MKKSIILSLTQLLLMLFVHVSAQQTEVGTLNGQLTVSPTGAAVYTIQLELPDGRGGLTPQMALQYNSQAGDGILGKGWGLSGLSYVGREAENAYYSGLDAYQENICRVDFDDDHFSIDGNRLILIEKLRGAHVYRFETDNGTRIIHHDPPSSSKDYEGNNIKSDKSNFEVMTPDGSVRYFGTTDSKQINGIGRHAIRYYLDKVIDINGNTITYDYLQESDEGGIYLSKVTYGKNDNYGANNNSYYELRFVYDAMPDIMHNYTAIIPYNKEAYEYTVSKLLDFIELNSITNGLSTRIKKWDIDYLSGGLFGEEQIDKGKRFIKQITYTNGGNVGLNPTVFEWTFNKSSDEAERQLTYEIFPDQFIYETNCITGDFNGDGISDIAESFMYPELGTFIRLGYNQGLTARLDIDETFQGNLFALDLNGDGKDELIVTSTTEKKTRIYTLIGNETIETDEIVVQAGDFNGDGLKDLITSKSEKYYYYPGKPDIQSFFDSSNG